MTPANLLPIVISGAGPSGLLLSLWLTKFGIRHRIFDPNFTTGTTSRALVVHARTLEFYEQLGFADRMIGAGAKLKAFHITYGGLLRAAVPTGDAGIGQSKFPFILSLGQDAHEAVLLEELKERGGNVEWGKKVTGLEELEDRLRITVEDRNGATEIVDSAYVAGCDGAHSVIRKLNGLKMEGGTYDRRFFVADVEATGKAVDEEATMNICLTVNDFCLAMRMKGQHRARLIGFTPEELGDGDVTFQDCLPSVERALGTDFKVLKVNWFSHYKVHHRHADHFQKGRSFVFGDAAHLHSPVGGQGMNTGLGDVTNFAWKLASVIKADSEFVSDDKAALLATYDTERSAFAKTLVSTTDTIFQWATSPSYISKGFRAILFPYIMPIIVRTFDIAPQIYARTAQLAISYEACEMSSNAVMGQVAQAGQLQAGRRLPWLENVTISGSGEKLATNFDTLREIQWQGHVFGRADWAKEALAARRVPYHSFVFTEDASKKGFRQDVLYLLRPDGHVGFTLSQENPDCIGALNAYMRKWGVKPL